MSVSCSASRPPVVHSRCQPSIPTRSRSVTQFNTCGGLTSNISPRRKTIATQETISAWFWMTNSWLSTGGFLLVFLRIPMSTRRPNFATIGADVVGFCLVILLSFQYENAQYPIKRRARQKLNGVSLFCWWEDPHRERAAAHEQEPLFTHRRETTGSHYRFLLVWSVRSAERCGESYFKK